MEDGERQTENAYTAQRCFSILRPALPVQPSSLQRPNEKGPAEADPFLDSNLKELRFEFCATFVRC